MTGHIASKGRARFAACALCLALAFGLAAAPGAALADVRKADVVYGQTVDARGLSVAQCPSIDAEYAAVMDAEGTVYFERNADAPTQIASITKIMTGLVALDAVAAGAVSLDTPITVSAEAASVGESSAELQEGDVLDLGTALKALLVPSGNDAAVAIAETVGGSVEGFVEMMNAKAAELGCTDTVYENPHGLDYDAYEGNLHSTAADVARVVQAAMKDDTFRAIVGGGSTTIQVERGGQTADIYLETTDGFLDIYEHAIGVKTGVTLLAGPSFAGAANNGERELYAIVIHSSSEAQRFEDAKTLCEWVYAHLVNYPLANSPETTVYQGAEVPVIAEVAHEDWIDKTVKATLSEPEAAVDIFDLNGNVSQSLEFEKLSGNVRAGDKVGTATFKQRNAVIATFDLVACEDVAAPDFFEGVGIWWDRLFRGFSGQEGTAQTVTLNETPLIIDKTAA
ncbi:D-alanyl-D-alanine carboxypeptidase family protein [Arabiibacter massiliensis]|uniref:D-alanyl-D-alanine carboxypeptidase family protein n=1 Tax=Arabiibacter massiliensis TaxID=1870985 RepID=UPI0009B965CF|nr:D-alanyl-D-alanine carboxypeptidase family protein [Arabiibacter massiliensis]